MINHCRSGKTLCQALLFARQVLRDPSIDYGVTSRTKGTLTLTKTILGRALGIAPPAGDVWLLPGGGSIRFVLDEQEV